jgi:DNA-directed RNA polymerase subunit H (RpoH/RPB5)
MNKNSKIYKNIHKLIKDRNYTIISENKLKNNDIIFTIKNNISIYIIDINNKDINLNELRRISKLKYTNDIKTLIIIANKVKINITLMKYINTLDFILQLLDFDLIQRDPITHILVPKHELLSKQQKDTLLNKSNIKLKDIPKIYINDPIAKWYGGNIGDIFKITRIVSSYMNISTMNEITYRVVINPILINDGLI